MNPVPDAIINPYDYSNYDGSDDLNPDPDHDYTDYRGADVINPSLFLTLSNFREYNVCEPPTSYHINKKIQEIARYVCYTYTKREKTQEPTNSIYYTYLKVVSNDNVYGEIYIAPKNNGLLDHHKVVKIYELNQSIYCEIPLRANTQIEILTKSSKNAHDTLLASFKIKDILKKSAELLSEGSAELL